MCSLRLYGPLLLSCSLYELQALGDVRIGAQYVVSAGLIVSLCHLCKLDKQTRGAACILQQLFLFVTGLLSWPDCCSATSIHLAICSAFWLFAHEDVQWWHALPLQAAETAVAMGVRLNQASSGQVTASEVAYMAVAYLAIGLVPPAAALCWRGSGDGEPHGEAIRIGCQQQQQKDILEGWLVPRSGSSEAEMVRITQLDFQKLLSRWPSFMRTWNSDAPPELLSPRCGAAEPPSPEDVLQLLCQLVSRGLLNASQVEQQLELAVKRGQEEGRVLLQARRSSGSSSRCPSTRPSTSFSSSSAVCEAALLSLSLGGGGPLTATPSPVELLPNALDQPPLQQPHPQQQQQPLQQQEGAAAAHCPRALAMHTAAGPCVQLPGRQRLLMRSRTAASLGAHCRQELPPIVEVAHEGFQPQLAALRSTCQLPVQQAADPCLAQRWSWPLAASVLAQLDAHFALPGRAAGASRASCDGHGAQEEEGRRALSKPRPGSTRQVKSEDGLVAGADCGGAEQGLGLNRSILEVTDASCRTRGLMTLVGPPQPPTARHGTYPCAALQGSAIPAPEQLPQQQLEQLSGDGAGSAHEAVEGDAREQGPRGSGEVVAPPQGSSTSADCSCSSHAASDHQPPILRPLCPPQPSPSTCESQGGECPNMGLANNGAAPQLPALCSATSASSLMSLAAQGLAASGPAAPPQLARGRVSPMSGSSNGGRQGSGSLRGARRSAQLEVSAALLEVQAEAADPGKQERQDSMGLWLDQQAHLSDNLHKEEEEEEMEEEEEAAGSHPCRPIQEDGQGCWVETEPCSRGEPAGASSRSLAASEAATQTGKADRVAGPGDAAGAPPQVQDEPALALPPPGAVQAASSPARRPFRAAARDPSFRFNPPVLDASLDPPAYLPPLPLLATAQSSSSTSAPADSLPAAEEAPGAQDGSGPRKASGEPGREPGSDGLPLCQHRRPLDLASADQGRALSRGGLAPEQTKGSAAPSQSSSSSCRRVSFAGDCPLEAPAGGLPCTSSSQPDAALGAPLGVWGPAPSGQLPLKQQQQQQRDGAQTHQGDGQEVPPQEQVPARRPSPSILEQPSAGTTSGGMCGQAPHPPVGAATPPTQSTRPTPGQLVLSARGQDHGPDPGAPARHSQDGHAQCLAAAPLPSPQRSAATSGLRQDAPSASSPSALQQLTQRFPPQRQGSNLLKHLLPDSMRANLQGLPAKAGEQSQATPYAASNHNGGRRMRSTGDNTELEVENTIITNRRYLDASKVLLDEIQVNKVLGFGSMGMVYFGVLWDTKVVVKMIEHGAGLLGKEQNRGKLARTEAVLSRMLLHPNVVITYDCCTGMMDASRLQVSGTPSRALRGKAGRQRQMTVMVQEFCDAGTLSDALQKRKYGLDLANPGYPELVLQLALDIANGIKYMHSLRVLHIDLKAENILLTRSSTGTAPATNRPGQLTAKVADLGLALVMSADCDEVQSGIHGTVSHMPPEAMRGTTFSMATDVYSFGVVLWELATQGKPFAGLVAHQVIEAVCDFDERPAWPESLHPKLTGLKGLAVRCWDASPLNRPSIFEVVDRLHELVDPSLAVRHSEGANSIISDESDELEIALRSQSKLPATAPQQYGVLSAGKQLGSLQASKEGNAEMQEAPQPRHMEAKRHSNSSSHKRRSSSSKRASSCSGVAAARKTDNQTQAMGLQAIMAAGPPRDMLSRMLYYLAQVPPLPEQLQRVEVGGGIVRFAATVDMSGLRAR